MVEASIRIWSPLRKHWGVAAGTLLPPSMLGDFCPRSLAFLMSLLGALAGFMARCQKSWRVQALLGAPLYHHGKDACVGMLSLLRGLNECLHQGCVQ